MPLIDIDSVCVPVVFHHRLKTVSSITSGVEYISSDDFPFHVLIFAFVAKIVSPRTKFAELTAPSHRSVSSMHPELSASKIVRFNVPVFDVVWMPLSATTALNSTRCPSVADFINFAIILKKFGECCMRVSYCHM